MSRNIVVSSAKDFMGTKEDETIQVVVQSLPDGTMYYNFVLTDAEALDLTRQLIAQLPEDVRKFACKET